MANTTVNIDIQVQSKSLNELEQELADINAELKDVPVNSQAFKDLSQQAQGLTKELDKAQQAAEGFTSEEKFRAADGAIKLMGGSLASVVGTLGVLGVESEAFGEFEEKAASAIAVAIGFKDVGEGITQLGPLLGKAGSAVKGFSITTKQALIATGIGAFVVILGTVIAYWDDITAAVEEFGEKIPFVGKAIEVVKEGFDALVNAFRPVLEFLGILPDEVERANAAMIESNNELIQSHEREIAILEASGAAAEEVYRKKKELLEAELDNLKRNNADAEEIYKKETELKVLEAKETTRKTKEEQDKQTENAKKAAEDRVAAEEKAQEDIRKAIEQRNKEYKKFLTDKSVYNAAELAAEEAFARNIEGAKEQAEQLLKVERDKLAEEKRLRIQALEQQESDGLISFGTLMEAIEQVELEYAQRKITLEAETQATIDAIKLEGYEKEKQKIEEVYSKKREEEQRYRELATEVLDNIIELSQQRYDREVLNLQRQRSEVETNTNLTEEERIAALNRIEARERSLEERRIKAERDQFTLQQTLLIAEEVMKTKFFVAEQIRIAKLAVAQGTATAKQIQLDALAAGTKAKMSIGAFVNALGPFGIAAFAISIGGIIASIISARRSAKAQIASLAPGASVGGGAAISTPAIPTSAANQEERAPQQLLASPMTKTYVLTGDVTSGQEAEAKLNTKRTIG